MLKCAVTAAMLVGLCVQSAHAEKLHVAVASNFTAPAKQLASVFERKTGHKVILSFGGTGVFYGQIKHGAPYDVLLAADSKTTAKAVQEGYAAADTEQTYAVGKLVLWSADPNKIRNGQDVLKQGAFDRCAVANPALAPYGLAAYETMKALGVFESIRPKLVEGDNVGKAFQFVKTGNADIGFVALSQVAKNGKLTSGSGWIVPERFYGHIKQNAVVLNQGKAQGVAREFLAFLRTPDAVAIKTSYGYGTP